MNESPSAANGSPNIKSPDKVSRKKGIPADEVRLILLGNPKTKTEEK